MVRILYLILLAAAALFYPLYTDKLSYLTLVTLIILPIILLCQLIISTVFLKCRVLSDNLTIFKGEESEICIRLSNNSVFPLSGCKLRIKAVFRPTGEVKYYTAAIPLPALRTQTASVSIDGLHCGAAEITLEYLQIYDLLRLFSIKCFKSKEPQGIVYIIPKIEERHFAEAQRMLDAPPAEWNSDNETSLKNSTGVPGDVTGFREFMPGDRLSNIHYKLSARFDKDIVKEMSPMSANRYLLTADISADKSADERDELLSKLLSCAHYLYENNAEVYAAVPGIVTDGTSCRTIALNGGAAAAYDDSSVYFDIARALSAADFAGVSNESGFICCQLTNS